MSVNEFCALKSVLEFIDLKSILESAMIQFYSMNTENSQSKAELIQQTITTFLS